MLGFRGTRASARVMIDRVDDSTREQILTFLDSPAFAGSRILAARLAASAIDPAALDLFI